MIRLLLCAFRGDLKVDLAQIDVCAHDGDHHGIAQVPVLAGNGGGKAHTLGKHGAGSGQAGSGHKALHAIFQLNEQAALGHAGDAALVALAQMAACILGLIAVLGLALDLHGDDFALAGLLADVLGKLAVTLVKWA